MAELSKIQLSNRILTCQNELRLANTRLKADLKDKRFWTDELMAAEAAFHGFSQGELKLNCKGCGE